MKLQRFIDVGESRDLPAFRQRLHNFADAFDFERFGATLVVDRLGAEAKFIPVGNNIPPKFTECLDPKLSKRDPLLKLLKRSSTPVAYDQSLYVANHASDLWDIQAVHGYRTGIAVALHLPHGRHFLLGFDREATLPKYDEQMTSLFANLQLLAGYAHVAAIDILAADDAVDALGEQTPGHKALLESTPLLTTARPTKRELEVLHWTLEGKTAWEVGMVLNISERTAAIHANRATHKLGCVNKHHAALKAMQLGFI